MIKINRETINLHIVGILLLLAQNIVLINYFTAILAMCLIIYYYIKNKLEYSLFLLLLFSIFTTGINFYTFKIVGVNLYYVTMIFLIIYTVFKINSNSNFQLKYTKISRIVFYYIILISSIVTLTVENLFTSTIYAIKDFNILFVLPFLTYILFKNMDIRRFIYIVYNIISIKVISALVMFITGFTLFINDDFLDTISIDNTDELSTFYFLLLMVVVLVGKEVSNKWLNIVFIISLFGLYFFGLSFFGLGSQTILMIGILLIFIVLKNKYMFVSSLVLIVFLINGSSLFQINNELLAYKLENIGNTVGYLDKNSIYLIPHSPQVRVIELINLFSYPWYNILFGHGLGGYFTDSYFSFNEYIGKYDFTEYEIETRNFYNPHNLGFGILKFGIFWILFILFLVYKSKFINDKEVKLFVYLSLFVLLLNIGYGIKTSILFGIVFIILSNSRQVEGVVSEKN